MKLSFPQKLEEGLILSRPNRFIIEVKLKNKIFKCHCPSTGRIGNLEFKNIPCLLSKTENPERKTPYTVEAISLNNLKTKKKKWIGINQTKINHYVEFFLKNKQFKKITSTQEIKREVKFGDSRIDFKIGEDFLEVKMPLISLPTGEIPQNKAPSKFNSFDRLIKHFNDLAKSYELKLPAAPPWRDGECTRGCISTIDG